MKITAVRHTSVDVPKGTCYGITDVVLAPTFRNELAQVRQNLGEKKFDVVISSPLKRCTILAAELAKGLSVQTDSRLTELDFGDWEMTDWDTIFESANGRAWFADYANTPCPNGESFAQQIDRIHSFLLDLQKGLFSKALIVTHAGVIRAMMCLLQGKTPEETFRIPVDCGQINTFNLENSER